MAREINLVPDIKLDMIKALKLRNLIFFLCIVIGIACVGIIFLVGSVAGAQQLAVEAKKDTLDKMSAKLKSYDDLSDFLTIRNQLQNLSNLDDNKTVLSRTFNILSALLPTNGDIITVSELRVNLEDDVPTFTFDAQADARNEPKIDYNVLDAFKKSLKYMRYDYGNFVDQNGSNIPPYCIIEHGSDGSYLNEKDDLYALWLIDVEGCNPSDYSFIKRSEVEAAEEEAREEEEARNNENNANNEDNNSENGDNDSEGDEDGEDTTNVTSRIDSSTSSNNNYGSNTDDDDNDDDNDNDDGEDEEERSINPDDYDYVLEKYPLSGYEEGNAVDEVEAIRIWRTPQYEEWFNEGHMTETGVIRGVPHFDSQCITYSAERSTNSDKLKWTETNESCLLVPDGDDGIVIRDSSNGKDSSDQLVLRFSSVISLNPEAYKFKNFHLVALGPSGRHNVTDSYVQIQAMFAERARDCEPGDNSCKNTVNLGGN